MFLLFFGGLSFHLLKALFCHAFSINMEWTTTAKEISAGGFRVGLDRIVRDFWSMYVFLVVPAVGGMIYLAVSVQSFSRSSSTITNMSSQSSVTHLGAGKSPTSQPSCLSRIRSAATPFCHLRWDCSNRLFFCF
jgi:hypothetical protein